MNLRIFYENGNLKSDIHYKGEVLDGTIRIYYPAGQINREIPFRLGLRDGVEKSWYETGQLFTEVEYAENKPLQARSWSIDGVLVKDLKL